MSKFTILLGGDVTPTDRLRKQVAGSRVIAADSGIAHAPALGLSPELWVGDFDSSGSDLERMFAHVPRHVFPPPKDSTDGEIALRGPGWAGSQGKQESQDMEGHGRDLRCRRMRHQFVLA